MESQKDIQKDVKVKKTEKLVTAIFMVTDLMDKAEPLRTELRSLSLNLLSGISPSLVSQIVSLINISISIGLVSDMNGGIINKELCKLNESTPSLQSLNFSDEIFSRTLPQGHVLPKQNNNVLYKSRMTVSPAPSFSQPKITAPKESKNDRRETILKLIKEKKEVTIKDISVNISGCSEKTIQRELISLLKDNVIKKTGEKRWSRYFMA